MLLFYSIYVSGVAQKIEGRLKAWKGVRIFNMLLGSREKFGKAQDMVVLKGNLAGTKEIGVSALMSILACLKSLDHF